MSDEISKLNSLTVHRDNLTKLYNLKDEFFILYVLGMYYHHGKITEEKYKGQIKSLRQGNLQKFKHSYKCTLNDKWYGHESAEGKNYNFAINVLYENYVKPMLKRWAEYVSWEDDEFIESFNLNIDYMTIRPVMTTGCRCWECGRGGDEVDVTQTVRQAEKELLEYFHNQKHGNLSKIPRYESGSNYIGKW